MQGQDEEHWKMLCEQAATGQDHARLMELIHEIDALLSEKEERLRAQQLASQNI
jgi:hypothetical protein